MNIEIIKKRIEFHEGFRAERYLCTEGYNTIGIGRNLDTNPMTPSELSKIENPECITKEEAYMLLDNDIKVCVEKLKKLEAYVVSDEERRYALLDMCFQLGYNGLVKFKNMLSALTKKDYEEACAECLSSLYAKQTPNRAKRIARLIKSGVWSTNV